MRRGSFTRDFLLLFTGPLVWAVHFVAIYGFTGIVCARPPAATVWSGVAITSVGIVGAGLLAVALIAAICLGIRPSSAADEERRFVRWASIGLGLLAIVAIVFETVTVFLVPACT